MKMTTTDRGRDVMKKKIPAALAVATALTALSAPAASASTDFFLPKHGGEVKKPHWHHGGHNPCYNPCDDHGKPEPVKPEPVKPEPVKPEPVKPEPVKPEPVKPEPVKPEPVKPDHGHGHDHDHGHGWDSHTKKHDGVIWTKVYTWTNIGWTWKWVC